jgi:hypothetical protein
MNVTATVDDIYEMVNSGSIIIPKPTKDIPVRLTLRAEGVSRIIIMVFQNDDSNLLNQIAATTVPQGVQVTLSNINSIENGGGLANKDYALVGVVDNRQILFRYLITSSPRSIVVNYTFYKGNELPVRKEVADE